MPQIIPIKELKNTAAVSEMCHSAAEPIFITKNGYGDMVLMSMEVYEKELLQTKRCKELEISEQNHAGMVYEEPRKSPAGLKKNKQAAE